MQKTKQTKTKAKTKTKDGQQSMPVIPELWTLRQEDYEFEAA